MKFHFRYKLEGHPLGCFCSPSSLRPPGALPKQCACHTPTSSISRSHYNCLPSHVNCVLTVPVFPSGCFHFPSLPCSRAQCTLHSLLYYGLVTHFKSLFLQTIILQTQQGPDTLLFPMPLFPTILLPFIFFPLSLSLLSQSSLACQGPIPLFNSIPASHS